MNKADFHTAIGALVAGERPLDEVARQVGANTEIFPALAEHLTADLPIDALERVEELFKSVLVHNCRDGASGETARTIAAFQQRIGFLLKYKPYAVKCTSPLGYSIFLQNAGEGFSFQRHVEHKVEVFHIVDVLPGGYIFLCDFDAWEQIYEPDAFAHWLEHQSDPRYDRYRYEPTPGDVVIIEELNVVHAILGCVVEEFATVSTDMVDRLHDQNSREDIPPHFNREFAHERLAALAYPHDSRLVRDVSKGDGAPIARQPIEGGSVRELADSFVGARHYSVDGTGPLLRDDERATSIYVTSGEGRLLIADDTEIGRAEPPALPVSAGDLLTILPGIHYRASSSGAAPLEFSEQRIAPGVALSPPPES